MTARVIDCTPTEYFADPCETPSLSSSIAKTLILKSPLHAWAEHPKLGNIPREQTEAMKQGQLVHAIISGHRGQLDVIDAPDFRTNAARELRDDAIAAGRTPVLQRNYEDALLVCATYRQLLDEQGIDLSDGEYEVPIEWHETGRSGPVVCRGMLDYFSPSTGKIIEFKTISSAGPETCAANAYRLGYDIQHAANISAAIKLCPELAGRIDYRFVFIEMDMKKREIQPPYVIVPRKVTGTFAELGERRWYRAVEIWERCLINDDWPAYPPESLDAPLWALKNEDYNDGS